MEVNEENLKKARRAITYWECLPSYSHSEHAADGLALTLLNLAADWEQADWLVAKVLACCPRRPTPIEMRRLFCSGAFPPTGPKKMGAFPPADGIEPSMLDISESMPNHRKGQE